MISDTKKYAILWLNSNGSDPKTIAKELKISLDIVQDTINQANTNKPDGSDKSDSNFTQQINSKNLMITHTSGKKTNSVAIMTREASETNDAKNKAATPKTNKNIKGIFKPKG